MADQEPSSALTSQLALSFGGVKHAAEVKQFDHTVVLVPFFGAQKSNLRKHWEFLNDLGFDCVVFELYDSLWKGGPIPLSATGQFGYKHIWADQVERILNQIPGRKIVYAFSNPGASAIEAIARRSAIDVDALICDSGPSGFFERSMRAYFSTEEPLRLAPLRWVAASVTSYFWNLDLDQSVHRDLERFPKNFPILSIRGWKDALIPPDHIDRVFEPHLQLQWRKLGLPEAGHLNGLRDFPDEYKDPVAQFLKSHAHPLKSPLT